jgi:hypothetical protein
MLLLCPVLLHTDYVITKGRGNRPVEALATLYSFKEGAKFYYAASVDR